MNKNNGTQVKISSWQKTYLMLFGIAVFILILELALRLGGFILLSLQEHRNIQAIKQKGVYRIMCLGESTTASKYPGPLKDILNNRNIGVRFSVIDKGIVGTDTIVILSQLKQNLAIYKPDMVVTMMGINDWGEHIPYETAATSKFMILFKSLKTYKLARLLWLHILTKAKETGFYRPDKDKRYYKKIQTSLPGIGLKETYVEPSSTEGSLKKAVDLNPKNDRAHFELGRLYRIQGKYLQAEDSLKEAVELNPKSDNAYSELGWLYRVQGKSPQAEDLFKKALELKPKNDRAYGAISILCEEIGKAELAKEYANKANQFRLGYYNPVTVNNYRKLKRILNKSGVRFVCVQYPMRSVEPLKKIFEGEQEGVVFVDNELIFKDAIKKGGFKAYFKDMFAGDFGHCTTEGNRLLAENIADTIIKEVFHK